MISDVVMYSISVKDLQVNKTYNQTLALSISCMLHLSPMLQHFFVPVMETGRRPTGIAQLV